VYLYKNLGEGGVVLSSELFCEVNISDV